MEVLRYANRVPLQFSPASCAITQTILGTNWRSYGLAQSRGGMPKGPVTIMVHVASVWVPFTSESKEAIADYDEIRKEITLALRECGRRLGAFLKRRERAQSEFHRRNIFDLYIEEVVDACNRLKGGKLPAQKLKEQLQKIALKRTGGEKTDEALGKTDGGPEGLPHSIIVTPEGVEGEVPALSSEPSSQTAPSAGTPEESAGTPEEEEKVEKRTRPKGQAKTEETGRSKSGRAKRRPRPKARHKTHAGKPAGASAKRAPRKKR